MRRFIKLIRLPKPYARRFLYLPLLCTTLFWSACNAPNPASRDESNAYENETLNAEVFEELETVPPLIQPSAIGEVPTNQEASRYATRTFVPARQRDHEYDTDELLETHRYIYRVQMTVPVLVGTQTDPIATPAGELIVDVSENRLRARFLGNIWPVVSGSEIRIRRDREGVYLIDEQGGRPVPPGELMRWFEGGDVTRRGPRLRTYGYLNTSSRTNDDEIGQLLCAFLAELGNEDRDAALRRCERGAPRLWRLGFFAAEQTANVPMQLPRRRLRADGVNPPIVEHSGISQSFLDEVALTRFSPDNPDTEASSEGVLEVHNYSATRVIVAVQGIPMGWVSSGGHLRLEGMRTGTHRVGAIRPLGAVVQRSRSVRFPGEHNICDGRCSRVLHRTQ